eukprot:CAMPEP_0201920114 /NCGR_PEP_ID=MMETSP0903-20130614/8811_1 /ASSEMBLY_ACC=CAM_ASM_000552 /TAXON_ID=420261 /ORGANISM="Thalassiosira antarctica, Strain CCMP982" /LENGTH=45 /DNA_ID= /DNA_START= /DNA_END= /DNA_ORIENTATION=
MSSRQEGLPSVSDKEKHSSTRFLGVIIDMHVRRDRMIMNTSYNEG